MMMDEQLVLAVLEAGDRLANVVENSIPTRYVDKPILRNALRQWEEAAEAYEAATLGVAR